MPNAIDLVTDVPGPRSKAILERKGRVVCDPLAVHVPTVIDRFGTRYTGRRTFMPGVQTFTVTHDDGARIFVDGVLIYERWTRGGNFYHRRSRRSQTLLDDYADRKCAP